MRVSILVVSAIALLMVGGAVVYFGKDQGPGFGHTAAPDPEKRSTTSENALVVAVPAAKMRSSELVAARPGSEPAGSTVGGLSPVPSRRQPFASEGRIVATNGLRTAEIQGIIDTDEFPKLVRNMLRESDSDSLEMTRIYRQAMQNAVSVDKHFNVEAMACGSRACAAIITGDIDDQAKFGELVMNRSTGPQTYTAMISPQQGPNPAGLFEYRIVFSTDPSIKSMQVP